MDILVLLGGLISRWYVQYKVAYKLLGCFAWLIIPHQIVHCEYPAIAAFNFNLFLLTWCWITSHDCTLLFALPLYVFALKAGCVGLSPVWLHCLPRPCLCLQHLQIKVSCVNFYSVFLLLCIWVLFHIWVLTLIQQKSRSRSHWTLAVMTATRCFPCPTGRRARGNTRVGYTILP